MLNKPAGVAWLGAAFMFVGYLTHLTLDEIYSVDVMDTRLKSSFGTALKFFDRRHFYASLGMAAATLGAIVISPPTATFVDGLSSRSLWSGLEQRLLPPDKWFGLVETPRIARRNNDDKATGVVTGSINQGAVTENGSDAGTLTSEPASTPEAIPAPRDTPVVSVPRENANP